MLRLALFLLLAFDMNGRWWGTLRVAGQATPIYLIVVREGATLRGTGGPTRSDQAPMQNGHVEGGHFIFDIAPGGRTALHFDVSATADDRLKGSVTVRRNGQPVTGTVELTKRTAP